MPTGEISEHDYRALAEFRYQLRHLLRRGEKAAREAGIEPQQHQLLLAVRGMPDGAPCSIGALAERLQVQHHSTVELVDRLVRSGYVRRHRGQDRRQVLIHLTAKGEKILRRLAACHRHELHTALPELIEAMKHLSGQRPARATRKKSVTT
jgi:DNA-binding MarR family transcriptional regulator